MNAQALNLNPVVEFLLNPENCGSDASRISHSILTGGQTSVDLLGAFLTLDQVKRIPQKARLHVTRIANFITSGSTDTRGFNRAYAIQCAMVALAPVGVRVTYTDAHYLLGASAKGYAAAPIPGVSRARMLRFIGSAGCTGTITTRVSSAAGKNGLWVALGALDQSDKHGFVVRSHAHPLLIAYATALDAMTDGALQLTEKDQ